MGVLSFLKKTITPRSDYDAANGSPKRRQTRGPVRSEDRILPTHKRDALQSGVSDLDRNLSIVAWAIRKHLDFNTQFVFHSQSEIDSFDNEFEAFFHEVTQPESFDVSGRHGFDSYVRLLEASAVLAGDCGTVIHKSGHVQAIESDRIRNHNMGANLDEWVNGVRVNQHSKPLAYAIHYRGIGGQGYVFDREVPAQHMLMHGYYSRFDQVRGVSPVSSAANDFQDLYEGKELMLAKMKVSQLFALAFYRDSVNSFNPDEDEEERLPYDVNFRGGPIVLDLDPGDRAEFLEGGTINDQTQRLLMLVAQVALKSLDIPFSFFDESFTNFFGSRGAWTHYERSCFEKRQRLIRFCDQWLAWRASLEIANGNLRIPESLIRDGYSLRRPWWQFVPVGMPWWDPSKEIDGDIKAINAGLTNYQKVCRQRGTDFYENLRQNRKALDFASKMGFQLGAVQSPVNPENVVQTAVENALEEQEAMTGRASHLSA